MPRGRTKDCLPHKVLFSHCLVPTAQSQQRFSDRKPCAPLQEALLGVFSSTLVQYFSILTWSSLFSSCESGTNDGRSGSQLKITAGGSDHSRDCTAKKCIFESNTTASFAEKNKDLCPHHIQQIQKNCISLQTEAHFQNISS